MVKIENDNLKIQVQGILNKEIKLITKNDLDIIKAITISNSDKVSNNLKDLKLFKNLTNCVIKNYEINQDNIEYLNELNKIDELEFSNCIFSEKTDIKLIIDKLRFMFCNSLKLEAILGENKIKYVLCKECDNLNLSGINNIDILELDKIILNKKMLFELEKSNINNIILNNCKVNVVNKIRISKLKKYKNIEITSKKYII